MLDVPVFLAHRQLMPRITLEQQSFESLNIIRQIVCIEHT